MAKKFRVKKFLAILLTLSLVLSVSALSAFARGGGGGEHEDSTQFEWVQVIVQGQQAEYRAGDAGEDGWLVSGVYTWNVTISGSTLSWQAGKQSGTVDLTKFVTIPEGYTVASFTATSTEVEGTNTEEDNYDNAIITVTIMTLYDETGEEIPIEEVYPNLDVVKTADKAVYEPGETITWTITVSNTGEVPATNVVVTDEYTGDSWTIEELGVGESRSFTATSVVPEDAADGSQIRNVAVATYGGDSAQDEETVEVDVPVSLYPNIEVVKTADKAVYEPGETITWTITVSNTGEAPATNVVVTDEYTGDSWTIEELGVGESRSFTATSVVPANAADGSEIRNVAVATWGGNETEGEEIIEVDVPVYPNIEVVKTADKAVYEPGETITWTITVSNTGEAPATNVVVTDEYTGDSWTIEELGVGESQIFTATSVVPADAADGSEIRNVAVATWGGNETEGEEIIEVDVPVYPNIEVVKTADKAVYEPGETITWTITVSNTGEAPATNVVVTDEYTGDSWTIEELGVGESQTFTATSVVPDDAADGSEIRNVAVATWDGNETEDEEVVDVDIPVIKSPKIKVVKTADKAVYEPGETITWTITVSNTGEAPATNVVVTDEYTGDSWTIEELGVGESQTFTATSVVPDDAVDGSEIRNVAVATWDGNETEGEETVEVKVEEPVKPPFHPPYTPSYPPVVPNPDPVEITDEEPPLAEEPIEIPDEEPPLAEEPVEILDEEPPLADVPQTGGMVVSGMVTVLSGLGLAWLGLKKKSDEE